MRNNQGFALMKILPFILLLGAIIITGYVLGIQTGFFNKASEIPETPPVSGNNPTYKKCVNNACALVTGVGINSCDVVGASCDLSATPSATPTIFITNTPPTTTPTPIPTPTATPTPVNTPTPIPTISRKIVTFQISSGINNVNQDGLNFSSNTNTIWIGNAENIANSYAAFRFTNVNIPKNSFIRTATLQGYNPTDTWIALAYQTYGDKSGNSLPFSKTSLPSSRTKTLATTSHKSNIKWVKNNWQNLADAKEIIQEIVNQQSWNSGNSLSLILKGTGGKWGRKYINGYNTNPATSARLTIEYQ